MRGPPNSSSTGRRTARASCRWPISRSTAEATSSGDATVAAAMIDRLVHQAGLLISTTAPGSRTAISAASAADDVA